MSKSYAIKIGVLFIFSALLCGSLYIVHEFNMEYRLKAMLELSVLIWIVLVTSVLIINNLYFIKTKRWGLNIMNWLLSIFMFIVLFMLANQHMGLWGFSGAPSLAFLPAIIAIIQDFSKNVS